MNYPRFCFISRPVEVLWHHRMLSAVITCVTLRRLLAAHYTLKIHIYSFQSRTYVSIRLYVAHNMRVYWRDLNNPRRIKLLTDSLTAATIHSNTEVILGVTSSSTCRPSKPILNQISCDISTNRMNILYGMVNVLRWFINCVEKWMNFD